MYRKNQKVRGRLLDPKEGPKLFDGNKMHFTMPFQGRRFTAIFFQIFPVLQQFLGAQGSPARRPYYRMGEIRLGVFVQANQNGQ